MRARRILSLVLTLLMAVQLCGVAALADGEPEAAEVTEVTEPAPEASAAPAEEAEQPEQSEETPPSGDTTARAADDEENQEEVIEAFSDPGDETLFDENTAPTSTGGDNEQTDNEVIEEVEPEEVTTYDTLTAAIGAEAATVSGTSVTIPKESAVTLASSDNTSSYTSIINIGTLTISGTFTGTVTNYGTLYIDGGTVSNSSTFALKQEAGTVTIYSGSITGAGGSNGAVLIKAGGFTMTGGTIDGSQATDGYGLVFKAGASITASISGNETKIKGATSGKGFGFVPRVTSGDASNSVSVSGGTFEGATPVSGTASGWLEGGYSYSVDGTTGRVSPSVATVVSGTTTTGYSTLFEANAKASSGATVTLQAEDKKIKNITLSSGVTMYLGTESSSSTASYTGSITVPENTILYVYGTLTAGSSDENTTVTKAIINNGGTVYVYGNVTGQIYNNSGDLYIKKGCTVTYNADTVIRSEGSLYIQGGTVSGGSVATKTVDDKTVYSASGTILLANGSANISGGTIKTADGTTGGYALVVKAYDGKTNKGVNLTIEGGTVQADTTSGIGLVPRAVKETEASGNHVTIKNGTFIGKTPINGYSTVVVPTGKTFSQENDTTWVVADTTVTVWSVTDGTQSEDPVAYFTSLYEAIKDYNSEGESKLSQGTKYYLVADGVDKFAYQNINIPADFTVEIAAGTTLANTTNKANIAGSITNNGVLTIEGSVSKKIENYGTLNIGHDTTNDKDEVTTTPSISGVIGNNSSGVVDLWYGTLSGNEDSALISRAGTVNIYGGSITGAGSNGAVFVKSGSFTMYGGTISGNVYGLVLSASASINATINGGTISGTTAGLFPRTGNTVTLKGGTFKGATPISGTNYTLDPTTLMIWKTTENNVPVWTVKPGAALTLTYGSESAPTAFTIDGESGTLPTSSQSVDVPQGAAVALTAKDSSSGMFLGWYKVTTTNDEKTNTTTTSYSLITTSKTYEFAMPKDALSLAPRYGKEIVYFDLTTGREIERARYTDLNDFTTLPDISKESDRKWQLNDADATVELVKSALGDANSVTVYKVSASSQTKGFTFTVRFRGLDVDAGTATKTITDPTTYKFTANDTNVFDNETKYFQCWKLYSADGKTEIATLSTSATMTYRVTGACTLVAVYGEKQETPTGNAVITDAYYTAENTKSVFVAYLTIPEGATMVAAGVVGGAKVTSLNALKSTTDEKPGDVINANTTVSSLNKTGVTYVKLGAGITKDTKTYSYTWTIKSAKYYARPFVTYTIKENDNDAAVKTVTIYGTAYNVSSFTTKGN